MSETAKRFSSCSLTVLSSKSTNWPPFGDNSTEEGRIFLAERSPLTFADRIARPLLIGQGANDPRVKRSESDQIVEAMTSQGIPVTYVLFPDEGHGFGRPENTTLLLWQLPKHSLPGA